MGEKADELHWGGLLWQRGKDEPYFLRDGKDGPETEIELLFRTKDSCEKVVRRMKATCFESAIKRLRENIDPDLADLSILEIADRDGSEPDDRDIPIFAAVRAFELAIHQNQLKLREQQWETRSELAHNDHAVDLESEYARAFIELIGIDVNRLTDRQQRRLASDCALMRPSNLPVNSALTKLAKTLSKLQQDLAHLTEVLEGIPNFAYSIIPHDRDVSPVSLASDLRFVLSQLERDALLARGSPHGARRGAELERDQILKTLTKAWLYWNSFGRETKDLGFSLPEPDQGETFQNQMARLIPDTKSSGAASNRGVWEFLKDYFERLKGEKPQKLHEAEYLFWAKDPTSAASRQLVLKVRQELMAREIDRRIWLKY